MCFSTSLSRWNYVHSRRARNEIIRTRRVCAVSLDFIGKSGKICWINYCTKLWFLHCILLFPSAVRFFLFAYLITAWNAILKSKCRLCTRDEVLWDQQRRHLFADLTITHLCFVTFNVRSELETFEYTSKNSKVHGDVSQEKKPR